MSRVALVTGGTRGIGRGCSLALKEAGYTVAANYGSNDERAKTFNQESGLPIYKWDVGDLQACEKGIAEVEADLGAIEILVNNAAISPDRFMHKMPPRDLARHHRHQPALVLQHVSHHRARHAATKVGTDSVHLIGQRPPRRHR